MLFNSVENAVYIQLNWIPVWQNALFLIYFLCEVYHMNESDFENVKI